MLPIEPELLNINQVAQKLGYKSKTSVEQKLKTGELKLTAYKRGTSNYRVFRRSQVLEYIDSLPEADSA